MRRPATLTAVALGLILAASACAGATTAGTAVPTATPPPTCPATDHLYSQDQLGWSFCYPRDWRFQERDQPSTVPDGLDTTFDIAVVHPSPPPGQPQQADQGLFGFMIIGTYKLDGAASLTDWAAGNLGPVPVLTPIQWSNARQAVAVAGTTKRLALTGHRVVMMDLHSGAGNLDLEREMGSRLALWRFDY